MNKSNTSQIKIRKKSNFRPIMLTSKSMKPVQRSHGQKNKHQDKTSSESNSKPLSSLKRRLSQNCALYSSQITKTEMIKRLTEDYREQLIKKLCNHSTSNRKSRYRPKPMTPTVVQVQFDNQCSTPRNKSRYEKLINGLQPMQIQSENLKKYFYCTTNKNYDNFVRSKGHHVNHSIAFKHFARTQSRQGDQWQSLMQKHYFNVKKIKPDRKKELIQSKISEEKLVQISMKVEEYQSTLLKKMQQKFKFNCSYQQDAQPPSPQLSPDGKSNRKIFGGDIEKIQEDIFAKRQTSKKQHFVFGMAETNKVSVEQINKQKFDNYKDFLWKINFSNGLYVKIRDQIQIPYKIYVGPGNNSMLIKGIMRRRFWWQTVEKQTQQTNFVWTQIKINQFFKLQAQGIRKSIQYNNRGNVVFRNRKAFSALQHHSNDEKKSQVRGENNGNKECPSTSSVQVEPNEKIFNSKDYQLWSSHLQSYQKYEQKLETAYPKRLKSMIKKKSMTFIQDSRRVKVQNHFECNYFLGNKKALFYSMKKYYTLLNKDPFEHIPLTFHISKGLEDEQYMKFIEKYEQFQEKKKNKQLQNIWIVKPGELTNRGRGITVCSTLDDIKIRLKSKQKAKNGHPHTYIVQKYIQKPLLYNKRKFDIRHYMMMACVNGKFKGYWFEEGYLRTTSYEYNIKNCKDLYTHLTNDAIQKYSADYGKFQKGNKVSYADFQKYLNVNYRNKCNKDKNETDKFDFFGCILPKMKKLATDAMRATYMLLSPKRYEHNFQLFGLDFMLDEDMNVYLIQVNTNPCLQTSSPLLGRLIPSVVENVFKICVDPLFPPPFEWPAQKKLQMGDNAIQDNKFTLVFDEIQDGQQLRKLFENSKDEDMGEIDEEDETYEDEGKEWVEDN